jgi:hypothetical protein
MGGLFGGNRAPSQGIQGPLTGQGIQTRPTGFMGVPEATTRRGETVRGIGGAVLGGMSPLGLLGAIAGKDIAQGKNPLGADGTVGSLLGGLFGSGDRQQRFNATPVARRQQPICPGPWWGRRLRQRRIFRWWWRRLQQRRVAWRHRRVLWRLVWRIE